MYILILWYVHFLKGEIYNMDNKKREVGEDATKYGEFVSSYFAWVPLPEQKEKVEELEDISKEKDNEKK